MSISIDRISLPMEEQESHPRINDGKPWPVRKYRMAYCGTVTLHDGKGEALHTIRYGRMPIKHTRFRAATRTRCAAGWPGT